jgi:hypothetical protein
MHAASARGAANPKEHVLFHLRPHGIQLLLGAAVKLAIQQRPHIHRRRCYPRVRPLLITTAIFLEQLELDLRFFIMLC